jgi:hypothetical protein
MPTSPTSARSLLTGEELGAHGAGDSSVSRRARLSSRRRIVAEYLMRYGARTGVGELT